MVKTPPLAQFSGALTDRELLDRFVADRDEAAFAALVERHGAMVLRICRNMLHRPQDAEDVCQATFLTLARKAGSIRWRDSVRCWLYGVARRLSLRARHVAARRRQLMAIDDGHEDVLLELAGAGESPLDRVARHEMRVVLDEELRQLPDKYRVPVVLCYLQGKTNAEAASELGWRIGSMSRRLARARSLLRDRLGRRGILLVLALAGLAALWPLLNMATSPRARAPVCFAGEAGPALARAAEADSAPDRGLLLRLAEDEAPRVAEAFTKREPEAAPNEWRRLTTQLRRSGVDLAQALAGNDTTQTALVARQMLATCHACHATFRH
jgi:RNA polymerase sigma factor (sigma-70 family)